MYINKSEEVKFRSKLYSDWALKSWVVRTFKRIFTGKTDVFIIGRGGVGKSILLNFLKNFNSINSKSSYSLTIEPVHYNLSGDLPVQVLDLPGQSWQNDLNKALLKDKFTQSNKKIIINVSAYGYNSFTELEFNETKYYEPGMSENKFIEAFRLANQKEDLKYIQNFLTEIQTQNTFLVNFVSKQDLWWDVKEEVKDYYEETYLKSLVDYFPPERTFLLSGAIQIADFETSKQTLLQKSSENYDKNIQINNLNFLLQTIEQLCRK